MSVRAVGAAMGAMAAVALLFACGSPAPADGVDVDASPSPNASILPAPLASVPVAGPGASSSNKALALGSAKRPLPASSGRVEDRKAAGLSSANSATSTIPAPLPSPDVVRVGDAWAPDFLSPRDTAGVSMLAEWKWVEPGSAPRAAEVNLEGIAAAKKLTAFRWNVLATESGRLKIAFEGRGFPMASGGELRSRIDVAAHLLMMPTGEYRIALPGALRALFQERRLDVLPLAAPEVQSRATLGARFGAQVRRIELGSKVGRITMDLARIPESGAGAGLLCRTLVELAAIGSNSRGVQSRGASDSSASRLAGRGRDRARRARGFATGRDADGRASVSTFGRHLGARGDVAAVVGDIVDARRASGVPVASDRGALVGGCSNGWVAGAE
ncbi:MAG: hypothetical protein U0165_18330 [Polyangiaceae bacterium]